MSTIALASGNAADDKVYVKLENKIADWTTWRDAIAADIKAMLKGSAFNQMIF